MTRVWINFNWDTVETFHNVMTRLINKNEKIDSIGATVGGQKQVDYLKNQESINYEQVHCVREIDESIINKSPDSSQIKKLENQFGNPTLWPAIIADRSYDSCSHYRQRQVAQGWFNFYLELFDDFQPDIFITTEVDSAYSYIPFQIVEQMYGIGIQFRPTRIYDRYTVVQNKYDDFESVYATFEKLQNDDKNIKNITNSRKSAIDYVRKFRKNNLSPDYTSERKSGKSYIRSVITLIKNIYKYHFYEVSSSAFNLSPKQRVIRNLKQFYRSLRTNYSDIFELPDYDNKFVYFPLHMQPEATTKILAPMYRHQQDLLRKLSMSIPLNYKIYVKEHPTMIGKRSISYYKNIDDISNVTLISPDVHSHELITESELVITITGTAGLESALYKHPTVVFGRPHYRVLSSVNQVEDGTNLPELLNESINKFNHNEKEIIDYITAIFEHSYSSPRKLYGENRESSVDSLANEIEKIIVNR